MVAIGTDEEHDVDLWDLSEPSRPIRIGLRLIGHAERVSAVAFAPDGHSLAAADEVGTLLFWDLSDPTLPPQLGPAIETGVDRVSAIGFADDSSTLAVAGFDGLAGTDGIVELIDLSAVTDVRQHAAELACDRVGRGFDRDEWARYVPNLPHEATC